MLRKSGDCFHYLFYLIRGVLLLGMLGACQSPLQETPRPTLPPQPTITATPVPLTSTAIPPTPEATPASRVIAPQSAAEVVELVKLDEGTITGAPLYSPDGQLLAIPTSTGIDLYDARTLQEVRSIPALSVGRTSLVADWPRFIAFSPDGQLLAAGMRTAVFSPDGRLLADEMGQAVFLWSVSDGTLVRQIPASPETTFLDLGISPGGEILAAGFSDGTVHLWHAATGEELNTLPGFELEFSPDGSMLVTMPFGLEGDNHIYLYDPASGTLSGQWDGQRAGFLPAGQLWVENNGALRIIDTDAGRTLHAFSGSRATFSEDSSTLAVFVNGVVKLYNVSDGAFLQTLEDSYLSTLQFQAGYEVPMYFADVKQLQFAPDGQSLAGWMIVRQCSNCVTTGTVLVLWRVSDGTIFEVVDEFYSDAALWLTSAPDGQSLVVATSDSVRFLRPSDSVVLHTLAGYAPAVDGIAFSPDGKFLASNSGQPYLTARLWQVADGQLVKRFADSLNPGSGPSNVAFSPDGQILWVQGSFWQVADGERLVRLEQKIGAVAPPYWASSLAFAPYGNTLAIGYLEGHLLLWDLAEEALLVKLEGYSGEVASLAFSPDGRTLASVYSYPNYAVQLWQVPEGERVLAIQGAVFSRVAFSPDGQILATLAQVEEGMDRGVAQLWRVSDGEQLIQLAANGVLSMAFSPDGQTLATGLYDHTVRLWHVADGALLNVLAGHSDYVTDLAFSPDGELLASGSNDGSVILWGIPAP